MPTFDRFRLLHLGGSGSVGGKALVKSQSAAPETEVTASLPSPSAMTGGGAHSPAMPQPPANTRLVALALTYDRAPVRFPNAGYFSPQNPGHYIHEAMAFVAPPGGQASTQVWLLVGPDMAQARWVHSDNPMILRVS